MKRRFPLLLAVLLLAMQPALGASNKAGKVVYAFGQVDAVGANGTTRALSRGDSFGAGETIQTRNGRTQLRFTDGGFAALQPNTEYRVEDYNFEGKADGNERSFMNLVRGSVRLVTGIIGRANKKNFRLRTAVATIGIRGTSGKVTHCDGGDCGANGPGTSLAGYGGVWDLNSGSYSGPVKPGQATFCDGSSCFDIPGFGQRSQTTSEETGDSEEAVADGAEEPAFTEGTQVDETGTQCELGGTCGTDLLVATGQIGATAFAFDNFGDTDLGDGLAVVFNNGVPVAYVAAGDTDGPNGEFVTIRATDAAALRQAFADADNPAISAFGLALLDRIPLNQLQALRTNPATVADEDFGRTSDDLLFHGRWQQGLLLDVFAGPEGYVFSQLRELQRFQSEHFIVGADPGPIPANGRAAYRFTGGTRSTAVDGSSIGQGVTGGQLVFDFFHRSGTLEMNVRHAGALYRVFGQLQFESDRFFFETAAAAIRGKKVFAVGIDGFFAAQGAKYPRAAGLAYVIETPVNIIGVAGFGNPTSSLGPGFTGPAANGSYVAFATNFRNNASHLTSNAFDFIVDGQGSLANRTNSVVTSLYSTFHPGLCAPACAFTRGGPAVARDPTGPGGAIRHVALGVDWGRFGVGHATVFDGLASSNGSAHVISIEVPTPTAAIPPQLSGKQGIYNMLRGGTRPTMVFETGGVEQGEVVGQMTQANMNIIFDTGDITAQFQGTVPGGMWQLAGSAIGSFNRNDGIHSLNFNPGISFVTSPNVSNGMINCSGSCQLHGHTHFDIAGVNASAVVGSIQGYTMQPSDPAFTVSGTYVSQGSVVNYP